MKKSKGVVAVIVFIVLLTAIFTPVVLLAKDYNTPDTEDDFIWETIGGEEPGIVIYRYTGNKRSVTVPETINGLPVKSIGPNAFSKLNFITKIILPKRLERIEDSAFKACFKLVEVNLPNSLISIDREAFKNCLSLNEIDIPGSVKSIGNSAFGSCPSLEKIILNKGLKEIGNSAFSGNPIKELILPEGLERLGSGAFDNCRNIKTIKLPDSLKYIGSRAFDYDTKIEGFDLPKSLETLDYSAINFNYNKYINSYEDWPTGKIDFIIPKNVTKLGVSNFRICNSITFLGDAPEVIGYPIPDEIENGYSYSNKNKWYLYLVEGNGTVYYYEGAKGFTDEYLKVHFEGNWHYKVLTK